MRPGLSMPAIASGLFRRSGKCAGNPPRISYIRPELVFRRSQQKSAHNPNEISTFGSELVFCQIPGNLIQRRSHSQRFRHRIPLQRTLLDPISRSILRVPLPPTRLRLLTPQLPTFRLATGALPTPDSRIRPKPLPTDRARSLPGLWHGDPSSSPRRDTSAGAHIKLTGSVLESRGGSLFARAEVNHRHIVLNCSASCGVIRHSYVSA